MEKKKKQGKRDAKRVQEREDEFRICLLALAIRVETGVVKSSLLLCRLYSKQEYRNYPKNSVSTKRAAQNDRMTAH